MIRHGSPMASRLLEKLRAEQERQFQAGFLFDNDAKLLQEVLAKEMQVDKPCLMCRAATRERGVFVPTTDREKHVLGGASNVFVYALCATCRPPQGEPGQNPTAKIDAKVVRQIMRERTEREQRQNSQPAPG